VISGFRHEVDEKCTLLVYYAASSGNSLSTFLNNRMSRNVGMKSPLLAA